MADRLLGADVLTEVAEFVGDLQKIYGGVQQRARAVYKLLRSPQVGFVVVTTLEPAPFAEAEFFCLPAARVPHAAARRRREPGAARLAAQTAPRWPPRPRSPTTNAWPAG